MSTDDPGVTVLAPGRTDIQCHLWHCERAAQPYCSTSHADLAVTGEEARSAITFIDGKKDEEFIKICLKIVGSKMQGKHCGVPHLVASDLCCDPWDLEGIVFFRELEPKETLRFWLFISEKDPEGFGIIWQAAGHPINLPGECVCQKYWLQTDYIRASGSFRLKRITGGRRERFNKAVYWLSFHENTKVDDEGEVTGVSSEGKPAKRQRQHMGGTDTPPLLPKVLQMDMNDYCGGESTSLKLNQFMMGYGKLVSTLDGSYVLVKGKVQTTSMEAMIPHLMGIFGKGRAKKLEEYLAQACPEFMKEMPELCDNPMVLFDNKTKDKQRKKAEQVLKLLSLVDSISRNCNGKPFTDELFHELQELRDQTKEVEALKGYDTMQQVYFRKQVGNKEGEVNDNESGKEKQVSVAD